MLCRIFFAILTLGVTLVYRMGEGLPFFVQPLTSLYMVVGILLLASLLYFFAFPWFKKERAFAGVQLFGDVVSITALIYLTGLLFSPFLFLYPIIIICGTLVLGRRGGFVTAGVCCVLLGVLADLFYFGWVMPPGLGGTPFVEKLSWTTVLYRTGNTFLTCILTAVVSGYIAAQERQARGELATMEAQVKRVEKMALIGEMAAGLAHEIKNPLASLSGSIQMLSGEKGWEPHHEKLMGIAVREADRLSDLVTEFLLFARPGTGRPVSISVKAMVEDTVALLRQDPKRGGVLNVEMAVEEGLSTLMDSGHLRQVLMNLLINAAEAAPSGGGFVRINARAGCKGRPLISVKDNGVGISKEVLSQIFDPFFTTKKEGTGLGLSIVHRLLEECGGGVSVRSAKGEGTEFLLSLPGGLEASTALPASASVLTGANEIG